MKLQTQNKEIKSLFLIILLSLALMITNCDGDSGSGVVTPDNGDESACTQITIPTMTIRVDGDTSDWSEIAPVVTDSQGDDSLDYRGDDIQAIYIAKDTENLYLRMDLWENANTNFGNGPPPYDGRYVFELQNNGPWTPLTLGVTYDNFEMNRWELGFNGSNGSITPLELQGPEFVGVNTRNGIIEVQVPLATIGNPTTYSSIMGMTQNCCATDLILDLDVTECVKSDI